MKQFLLYSLPLNELALSKDNNKDERTVSDHQINIFIVNSERVFSCLELCLLARGSHLEVFLKKFVGMYVVNLRIY